MTVQFRLSLLQNFKGPRLRGWRWSAVQGVRRVAPPLLGIGFDAETTTAQTATRPPCARAHWPAIPGRRWSNWAKAYPASGDTGKRSKQEWLIALLLQSKVPPTIFKIQLTHASGCLPLALGGHMAES